MNILKTSKIHHRSFGIFLFSKPIFSLVLGAFLMMPFEKVEARVFSFDKESLAPYLSLRGGLSSIGNEPYRWQSASTYSGDDGNFIYGGEFGLYVRGGAVGMALGVLVHTYDPVIGARAQNSTGTEIYQVDSEAMAYGPTLSFDYQFAQTATHQWRVIVGAGYQFAKIENNYTMTGTGQTLVGGQTTFSETYQANSAFAVVGVGTEFLMAGTTTISVQLGYHHTLNNVWSYGAGVENFAGAANQGGPLVYEDGSKKAINLSYPFLQVGFQFYTESLR